MGFTASGFHGRHDGHNMRVHRSNICAIKSSDVSGGWNITSLASSINLKPSNSQLGCSDRSTRNSDDIKARSSATMRTSLHNAGADPMPMVSPRHCFPALTSPSDCPPAETHMSCKITSSARATSFKSNRVHLFSLHRGGRFHDANFLADLAPCAADLVGETHAVSR